jgi:hypothetical protein
VALDTACRISCDEADQEFHRITNK